MNAPRKISNLALVGFMGTGKSSVGRTIAAQLHFQFVDTDDLIETKAGCKISEIFAQEGESRFREYERMIANDLREMRKTVISTGGGFVTNNTILTDLKQHALVICLWASPETIWSRVKDQAHRPLLLDTKDPMSKIRHLLEERAPFYRQADVLVNTERRSVREVAQHALLQFRSALSYSH
jgi:shikimate kinase